MLPVRAYRGNEPPAAPVRTVADARLARQAMDYVQDGELFIRTHLEWSKRLSDTQKYPRRRVEARVVELEGMIAAEAARRDCPPEEWSAEEWENHANRVVKLEAQMAALRAYLRGTLIFRTRSEPPSGSPEDPRDPFSSAG